MFNIEYLYSIILLKYRIIFNFISLLPWEPISISALLWGKAALVATQAEY